MHGLHGANDGSLKLHLQKLTYRLYGEKGYTMYKAQVTFSVDELIALSAMLSGEQRRIERLIKAVGDPNGVQAENAEMAAELKRKVRAAFKRTLK